MSTVDDVIALLAAIREALAAERRPDLNTESYTYRQVVTIPARRAGLTESAYTFELEYAAAREAAAIREQVA